MDKPTNSALASELQTVRIGFLPLTDCASLVIAAERGFDRKYGIRIELSREPSWASVRDKLNQGALDAAHVLYGMVYGVQTGIGCQQRDMAVLMGLSQNGQAITVSRALAGPGLAGKVRAATRKLTFAHTFPTGNHAMLLAYWLAAQGIDPVRDVRTATMPPTQMVAALRDGQIDGFCVGEPWGERAVLQDIGATAVTSQQIWTDHPGKVLGTTASYADRNPDTCRALVAALLEASRWIEESPENRRTTVGLLAGEAYLNLPSTTIAPRLLGHYQDGLGGQWEDAHALRFHAGGAVNFPYLSDGIWFMTQHRRWGLLREDPDYAAIAAAVNRIDDYRAAAAMAGVDAPRDTMRSATLIDGVRWDGSDPAGYAGRFALHHR